MRILIAGPPSSGKSSLAARWAKEIGGEVVDFDEIARTVFGSGSHHDHPDEVRRATRDEVERRIDSLEGSAVVIRSAPTVEQRREVAQRMRADRVVVLAVPADEAKRRATADNRPDWTAAAIDRWWARYQPDQSDEVFATNTNGAAMATEQDNKPEGTATDSLGDAGKKALDAERAARKNAEKALAEMQEQLKVLQDRDKGDTERMADKAAAAEKRAAEAEARSARLEVALDKGLTATQAKRLVGSTRDELEADADDLMASFKPAESKPDGEPSDDKPDTRPSPSGRPAPALQGGGDPTKPAEPTRGEIAAMVEKLPRF